jgi:hypothetical protein
LCLDPNLSLIDVPTRSQPATNLPNVSEAAAFGGEQSGWSLQLLCETTDIDKVPDAQTKAAQAPQSSASSALRSPAGRVSRAPIRRVGAQATKLESLDNSLGPLGPLGDNGSSALPLHDQPPVPPQKEQTVTHNLRQPTLAPTQSSVSRSTMDTVDLNDDLEVHPRPRIPPPVQPPQAGTVRRDTQPSVSIEQAAKPTFDITVGDPHKVGDLTSSHTVYQVRTKACKTLPCVYLSLLTIFNSRPPLRHTDSRNSLLLGDTETFYGYIVRYIQTIRV